MLATPCAYVNDASSFTVTWTVPEATVTVDVYKLQLCDKSGLPIGAHIDVTGGATQHTFTNVEPGGTFSARVRAEAKLPSGSYLRSPEWSAMAPSVTLPAMAIPEAPQIVVEGAIDGDSKDVGVNKCSVVVSWAPPTMMGCELEALTVVLIKDDESEYSAPPMFSTPPIACPCACTPAHAHQHMCASAHMHTSTCTAAR